MRLRLKNSYQFYLLWFFLGVLLAFVIFKNIQYPLLWNDEGETVMYAQQILKYGYPKIHTDKNTLYLLDFPNKKLGIIEKYDAYIGTSWGHFYFATIGVFLANFVHDIYLKTALLRIPFATAGLLGICVLIIPVIKERPIKKYRKAFLISYFILTITSVSLLLHFRQVRYYPLSILIQAFVFYSYYQYQRESHSFSIYAFIRLCIMLILMYLIYYPLFVSSMISLFVNQFFVVVYNWKKNNLNKILLKSFCLLIPLVSVIPLIIFFQNYSIAQEISSLFQFNLIKYWNNIIFLAGFLVNHSYFPLYFVTSLVSFYSWYYSLNKLKYSKLYSISFFLLLFIFTHLLVVARTPFVSERYIVNLLPLINIGILTNMVMILDTNFRKNIYHSLKILIIVVFLIILRGKSQVLKGYYYELFHPYRGSLDYLIPYIVNKYDEPEKLTIATNYEDICLQYYLHSKIIIGYAKNNLDEDLKLTPDIISYRKGHYNNNPNWFRQYLNAKKYKLTTFPVYDYPYNNITELNTAVPHLFQTKYAQNESDALKIFELSE